VVLQRVSRASVSVDGNVIGSIARGLVVLLGVGGDDEPATARRLAQKCAEMRLFPGDTGHFDRSLVDIGGEALVVSQFTLLADMRRGRRPSFGEAAPPERAAPLVDAFIEALAGAGVRVRSGRFGAMMSVELVNDGPVTIVLDSRELDRARR